MSQDLKDLIDQLGYLDHEYDTNVLVELNEAIVDIHNGNLTKDEATELLNDKIKLMKLNSVLEDDEHIRTVEAVIHQLPGLLFA